MENRVKRNQIDDILSKQCRSFGKGRNNAFLDKSEKQQKKDEPYHGNEGQEKGKTVVVSLFILKIGKEPDGHAGHSQLAKGCNQQGCLSEDSD